MTRSGIATAVAVLALAISAHTTESSAAEEIVKLWPGKAPGTEQWSKPETTEQMQSPAGGRAIQIIKNVTEPTLTVVRPAAGRASGAGMIVLPGGAFGALAWDLEGTEVARWLAERGVTAFVLKYRIHDGDETMTAKITEIFAKTPPAERFDAAMKVFEPRKRIAAEDAMQAVRVIRSNGKKYGVSPDRLGMMGFSAGAITTMSAVLEGDAASRPNFAAPIYGAMSSSHSPSKDSPPLFIAVAADDDTVAASKSTAIFQAWQTAKLPVELHIYENGGHGFGLGKPKTASAKWTDAFEAWLTAHALISGERTSQAR
ncbi:alpha/beta hydrolase [Steroidobacter flavus]|uniref:Alpha/beta hydrolase n=1 Tax=Steroidobacter flavus TaxID=1842136 RepID=A0ABV8SYC9_9GAMM